MKLTIQSIHFTASDRLNSFIQKKCDKLDTFYDRITSGHVALKLQKNAPQNKIVDIKVYVPGDTLVASEQADSFEKATDLCVSKLKQQIKRYKDKLKVA